MENSASVVNINSTRGQTEQDETLDRCALRALGLPGEAITEYLEALRRDTAKNVKGVINGSTRYKLLKELLTDHHIEVDVGEFNQRRSKLAQQDKDTLMELISTQDDSRTFCTLWNLLAQDPETFKKIPAYLRREEVESFTDTDLSITPEIAQQVIHKFSQKNQNLTPPLPLLQNLFSETPAITTNNSIDVTKATDVIPFPERPSLFSDKDSPHLSQEIKLEIQNKGWKAHTDDFLKRLETRIPNIDENIDPADIRSLARDINKILAENAPTSILPYDVHQEFIPVTKLKLDLPLNEFVIAQQNWAPNMINTLKAKLDLI